MGSTPWPGELEGASLAMWHRPRFYHTPAPSTFTHVLGVSGAPTGAVGGAADGRRSMRKTSFGTAMRVFYAVLCGGGTQWVMVSAATAENRMGNAHGDPKR